MIHTRRYSPPFNISTLRSVVRGADPASSPVPAACRFTSSAGTMLTTSRPLTCAALDELDPAIQIGQLTGNGRLRGLRGEAQRVTAARERLAVGRHRPRNRHGAERRSRPVGHRAARLRPARSHARCRRSARPPGSRRATVLHPSPPAKNIYSHYSCTTEASKYVRPAHAHGSATSSTVVALLRPELELVDGTFTSS